MRICASHRELIDLGLAIDKTQVFHDQIEAKQKELQPWTTKINAKKAAIDIATSERDTLAKKATGLKDAVKDAQNDLEQQQVAQQAKVSRMLHAGIRLMFGHLPLQFDELQDLKTKKAGLQKDVQAHAKNFQVSTFYVTRTRSRVTHLCAGCSGSCGTVAEQGIVSPAKDGGSQSIPSSQHIAK